MNLRQETRVVLTFILLACIGLIATAFYMEYQLGLEPCPMCIVQRIAVALAGAAALIGILHNNLGKFYLTLTGFFSLVGGASAVRHLYLQSLPPDRVPSCGPDLNYLLENDFISDALIQLFIGDGNCAEVMWSLLGISIPGWVLICCSLIFFSFSTTAKKPLIDIRKINPQQIKTQPGMDIPRRLHITSAQFPSPINN